MYRRDGDSEREYTESQRKHKSQRQLDNYSEREFTESQRGYTSERQLDENNR
jgi:hypothetical protein